MSYPYSSYSKLYLENTTVGHRKFYEMTRTASAGWIARWGKIGIYGQTKYYEQREWSTKLEEKLKKGYEVISLIEVGAPGVAPPPAAEPYSPDTLCDPETITKIDRIVSFLYNKGKDDDVSQAEIIKSEYIKTGVLTKKDMETLNKFWIHNGGGKW